jgi:glycosyltransferase involved in cell wall biosynthesis
MEKAAQLPATVQVIIPARNEQDCLGRCLESLTSQQGISYQITVVDDNSTDQTRAIAESFAGVQVIGCAEPPPGVSGKNNALITAAKLAQAEWILFTDADTFHSPLSLATAVREAQDYHADLLSYSTEQETGSLAEMALMPLIFAALINEYPPDRVNRPNDPKAAANGQYLLVRGAIYEKLGGHQAVATELLEDVALARLFKKAGCNIRLSYCGRLVRTRMYRNFRSMWEGWTKNLALLFPHPLWLATVNGLWFLLIAVLLGYGAWILANPRHLDSANGALPLVWGAGLYITFLGHVRRANFPWKSNLLALFGVPMFALLLVRSYLHIKRGRVTWKGRTLTPAAPLGPPDASMKDAKLGTSKMESAKLDTRG